MDLLGNKFGSRLSVGKDTVDETDPERKVALSGLHKTSNQNLEMWRPEGIQLRSKSFEDWLSCLGLDSVKWRCKPSRVQVIGLLRHVICWRDRAQVTLGTQNAELDLMVAASGMTMHQALELTDMSPEMIGEVCGRAIR